ncbi:unnamed protein product, partial [Musa acuminata subsp. burmannicoides]
ERQRQRGKEYPPGVGRLPLAITWLWCRGVAFTSPFPVVTLLLLLKPLLALIHPPYQSLERNIFFSVLFKRRTCIVVACAWPTRPPPFRILTARSLVVPRSELAMGADEVDGNRFWWKIY